MEAYKREQGLVGETMIRYGGSFVKSLGGALLCADAYNAKRIYEAFPEYWDEYRIIGTLASAQATGR